MQALVFRGSQDIRLESRPKPAIAASDDVLVRIAASGICGTDLNLWRGRFPAEPDTIIGHEAVGIVEAIGLAVTRLRVGDRVVIDPTLHCGYCKQCTRGAFNFCDNKRGTEVGVDRDGSHADYTVLPAGFVHQLPDDLPCERAVLVEPLACVLNNARAARFTVEDTVLVIGAGPIGLLWALLAKRSACRVAIMEISPFRLSFAGRIVDTVIDARPLTRPEALAAETLHTFGGGKPSLVVDTTGVMVNESIALVDKGGRVLLMGFNDQCEAAIKPLYLTNNGISLIGAGDYNRTMPAAIDLARTLPLEQLVTHRIPLEHYERAFRLLLSTDGDGLAQAMKVVLIPQH